MLFGVLRMPYKIMMSSELSRRQFYERAQEAANRLEGLNAAEWMPIDTAPRDGTPILIAAIEDGFVYDVLNGYFEVLSEDEDDGPWDIRGGEPWCSYVGREAGIYFCHWLPGKEWERRWVFGPNSDYTHWMPLPPTDRRTPEVE